MRSQKICHVVVEKIAKQKELREREVGNPAQHSAPRWRREPVENEMLSSSIRGREEERPERNVKPRDLSREARRDEEK